MRQIQYGKQSVSLLDIFSVAKTLLGSNLTQGKKVDDFETKLALYGL